MPKYSLDTNVYVTALRSEPEAAALRAFLASKLSLTYLSAVVMLELRAGARTPRQVEALEQGVIEPFERRGRVVAPSARAFLEAGRALAALLGPGGSERAGMQPGLLNDALLAASCREDGMVLVTRDRDFERFARHVRGFQHVAPWPS